MALLGTGVMNAALEALAGPATQPRGSRGSAVDFALGEMDHIYAFVYARVGNRADAQDLTQQVALKALPRLREGAAEVAIRSYLFAAARSVLANFWSQRLRLPVEELREASRIANPNWAPAPRAEVLASVDQVLARLRPEHRCLLELRFLRGYTLKEAAREMGKTVGGTKLMQLRALRAAAAASPI